jgi:hypothetical protein
VSDVAHVTTEMKSPTAVCPSDPIPAIPKPSAAERLLVLARAEANKGYPTVVVPGLLSSSLANHLRDAEALDVFAIYSPRSGLRTTVCWE